MTSTPPKPYFLRVTPDDTDIIEQIMFYGDRVHAIPDHKTILRKRIGGEAGSNREAFSIVVNVEGQRIAGATIFTHLSHAPIDRPSQEFLYGNIREILSTPAARLVEPANLMTCYSISSYTGSIPEAYARLMPNVGKNLVRSLYTEFNKPDFVISTCSPIRSVQPFLTMIGQDTVEDPELLKLYTAAHLARAKREEKTPQTFHQGNGAYAAVVHAHSNPMGGKDNINGHDIMVGYRYARTDFATAANQVDWRAGKTPASQYVRDLLRKSEELVKNAAPELALIVR